VISHIYKHDGPEGLKLPPLGVELDDAMTILDYYSLNVVNPRLIDQFETDLPQQLRAFLFLQQR
jgi:hypothetical protein